MSVKKGMERIRTVRSIAGDSARRNGFASRSFVVNIRVDDVVCSSRGRLTKRRAV